jgi:Ca2+-binding RTX toxin-like protein
MRRAVVHLAALLLVVVPLGLRPASTFAAPTCFGKPATHVMQPGDVTYFGSAGADVVVGTTGHDDIVLYLFGGTDLVCGGAGNDTVGVAGVGSIADGGAGNDHVEADSGAIGRGGAGDDVVAAFYAGSYVDGGSGNDYVGVNYGATGDGGSGTDQVEGVQGAALAGGSGSDHVRNIEGTPAIDCGPGRDTVEPNGATNVRRCEETVPS